MNTHLYRLVCPNCRAEIIVAVQFTPEGPATSTPGARVDGSPAKLAVTAECQKCASNKPVSPQPRVRFS